MTTKPECPEGLDWTWDAAARFDDLQRRAADDSDALSSREFTELNSLKDQRERYLAWRGRVAEWQANEEKAASRTPEQQALDPVGAALASLTESRRSRQHWQMTQNGQPVLEYVPRASGLAAISEALRQQVEDQRLGLGKHAKALDAEYEPSGKRGMLAWADAEAAKKK